MAITIAAPGLVPELEVPEGDLHASWKGRPRILVVEDDEDLCAGLQWLLSRTYDVVAEHSGLAALRRCATAQPDLLLVDYQLPDLNGIELLQVIRESSRVHAPALMVSAFENRAGTALRHGFSDFLAKPIAEWELMLAVERTLGI
jgi:CheY-like chemotaxis protein